MYEVHLKLRIAMFLVSSYFPHIINVGKVPRKSNIKGVRGGNFSQEFAERERERERESLQTGSRFRSGRD